MVVLSLTNPSNDFDCFVWVLYISCLIYFPSINCHFVEETHMMLIALKRPRKLFQMAKKFFFLNRKAKDCRTSLSCAFLGRVPLGCSGSRYTCFYWDQGHRKPTDSFWARSRRFLRWPMIRVTLDYWSWSGSFKRNDASSVNVVISCVSVNTWRSQFNCFKNQQRNQSNWIFIG